MTILSGFLGSGKTTLLRATLRGQPDAAVIVNEYGEAALDGAVVDVVADDRVVVGGGCVCCAKRDELARAMLHRLDAEERAHRRRSPRLVIETSGLADPAPILFTIHRDPVLRHHYAADEVWVTVDAVHGSHNLDRHSESVKQAAVADRLVVTKIDLARTTVVDALIERLRRLNPAARVDLAEHGEVLHTAQWPQPAARRSPPGGGAAHVVDLTSVALDVDGPVDWQACCVWLTMLLHAHGEEVLRVKGVVGTRDGGAVAVHGVQHLIHPPEHLPGRPSATGLVVIGRGVEADAVRRSFAVFQRLGGE